MDPRRRDQAPRQPVRPLFSAVALIAARSVSLIQRNMMQKARLYTLHIVQEVVMAELSEHSAAFGEQLAGDAAMRLTETNRHALDFVFSAQKAMLDEMMLAAPEVFDRTRTEMHLFSELASRMAEAHSVNNFQTMYEECSRHQIDFLRRDSERLFKHGERLIEATAKLVGSWRKN
jgi:hypothetical protein